MLEPMHAIPRVTHCAFEFLPCVVMAKLPLAAGLGFYRHPLLAVVTWVDSDRKPNS